jgi:lantibiotic modifying enzyme
MAWQPILEGEDQRRAFSAASDLANELSEEKPGWFPFSDTPAEGPAVAATLGQGHAGIALFYGEMFRLAREKRWLKFAEQNLNMAIEYSNGSSIGSSLFEGFSGVLYSAALLQGIFAGDSGDVRQIGDDAGTLLCDLIEKGRPFPQEFSYGLCGHGVYFLRRLDSPFSIRAIRAIVSRLKILEERVQHNLGMAHGLPAVIAFLANVHKANIERENVSLLLREMIAWLLEQRLSDNSVSFFPEMVGEDIPSHVCRLRWCYGDLPIAVSLWTAGVHLNVPEWRDLALQIFVKAAERPFSEAGTYGVSICHGLTSVAYILNRAYQATADERLQEASRRWFRTLLDTRKPATGIGGWTYETPNLDGGSVWPNNPGVINGASGVGLALIAAVSDHEPLWDGCMLLDMPRMAPYDQCALDGYA